MDGRPANEWTEERATVQVKLKKSVIFIIFDYKWESVLRPRGEGPIYLILALACLFLHLILLFITSGINQRQSVKFSYL